MAQKSLNVQLRTETGKNINRRLRNSGYIPAVLYSHGNTEAITVRKKDFHSLFNGPVSESVIFDIKFTGKSSDSDQMAFVKDYQTDPVSGEILHIDLFKVTLGEKIHTKVPIEYIGTAKGTKVGGQFEISERELEIECMPKNLPGKIEVDISELDIGDALHAKAIPLDEEITLLTNPETVLASVHVIKTAKEEDVEVEEEAEVPAEEMTDLDDTAESEKK